MVDEDVHKIVVITKTRLLEWNVMPFGLKNATSTFPRPWHKYLRNGVTNSLEFLWMMSTSTIVIGMNTWST
jgi:hypothetical protein